MKTKTTYTKQRSLAPLGETAMIARWKAEPSTSGEAGVTLRLLVNFILLIPALLQSTEIIAQKYGYIWVLGDAGGTTMDFNTSPPAISFADRTTDMFVVNASISDDDGQLLFYTNGCSIFDRENTIMENGQNINPGQVHNSDCVEPFNVYSAARGAIILPKPNSGNIYYLFHQGKKLVSEPNNIDAFNDKQYYSTVDMSMNNGLGKVVEKNQLIIQDTFQGGDLTAVKHANNIDWWLLTPKRTSNAYFKILFTSNGVESVTTQTIGDSTSYAGSGGGQAVFSPDGTKYVRYNPFDEISIFDFDRETGELSNYQKVSIPGDTAFVGGAAISPNSRYLYISSQIRFYQYDLQAPDIAASQVLLGEYDGYQSPFPLATTFFTCQLAPDCKIYCCTYNGCDVLHVVNYPDEPGLACNFVQHGVQLPSYNTLSMPNFPNYRLGTGQPTCTPTASGEVVQVQQRAKVYPNPASGELNLEFSTGTGRPVVFRLYDPTGRLASYWTLEGDGQPQSLNISGLASGLYLWQLNTVDGLPLDKGKLVIAK